MTLEILHNLKGLFHGSPLDIDECESSSVNCDQNADCFNSVGSYQCRCRLGYQGNGTNCVCEFLKFRVFI